jgi:hypothetical protein
MNTNPPAGQQVSADWDANQPPAPPMPTPPRKSWFARHKFLTVLLALVVLAGLSRAFGTGDTAQPETAGSPGGQVAAADPGKTDAGKADSGKEDSGKAGPADSAKTAKVGTAVRDGQFEFTVTKVEKGVASVGADFLAEKAQGQFVLVHVTVKNIGAKPQTLIDSVQKVRDGEGREFTTDSTAAIVIKGNDVFFNEINPGNAVKGTLVYDMPKGAKPASIELHDSMFSGGVTVTLS